MAIWAGGIAGSVVASLWLDRPLVSTYIGGAALLVGVVSFIDDRFHVPVAMRLGAHVLAAALLLVGGLGLQQIRLPSVELGLHVWVGPLLTVLFIVWMTNLYNFMDGMDGFAGGMAVFGFGVLGTLAFMGGADYFAVLCWVIAAAAGGFLVFNFPPARIFMGDTGASVLGLLAAALALWGDKLGLFPLWVALLVFSPFVVDATVTLIRRTLQRERVWEAHRAHYYQRLVQVGWGHRRTVVVEYALMLLCGASAALALHRSTSVQWILIVFWAVAYFSMMRKVERLDEGASLAKQLRR